MFDTHCHLNFKIFEGRVEKVINDAKKAGVNQIVVPGTDIETSEKAIEIAEKNQGIYAAVGIHPHHVFEIFEKARNQKFFNGKQKTVKNLVSSLLKLLSHPKVVAIGEVGIDRHVYQKTVYKVYKVEEKFIKLQEEFLKEQIKLAIEHGKSLILHNREAKKDMFEVLREVWDKKLEGRSVFHCCEPDETLLEFAQKHKMFIGIDGDVTYYKEKQEFIKTVPLEMLVLETDSPFLNPEPLRSKEGGMKNEPKNIPLIAEFVAKLKNVSINQLIDTATENARKLFKI